MKRFTIAAISAIAMLGAGFNAYAGDDEPKLEIKPTGRVLMDGAIYAPDGDGFADGAALPDIRLGAKVNYGK